MKVKILEITGYWEDSYSNNIQDQTDWEEISEEDYACLCLWAKEYNDNYPATKIIIVAEKPIDYKKTVADWKVKLEKHNAKATEEMFKWKEKERKRNERAAKYKADRVKKKLERDKKKFEDLKKRFEASDL